MTNVRQVTHEPKPRLPRVHLGGVENMVWKFFIEALVGLQRDIYAAVADHLAGAQGAK